MSSPVFILVKKYDPLVAPYIRESYEYRNKPPYQILGVFSTRDLANTEKRFYECGDKDIHVAWIYWGYVVEEHVLETPDDLECGDI